jgi:hypothetical protein
MVLPCKHRSEIVNQVRPTINLLTNIDTLHPEVLQEHGIRPEDYKTGLVFRSAIESIRGTFIASSTARREAFIQSVLDRSVQHGRIAEYEQSSASNRYDFTVGISRDPDYFAALEVKGGEGNSINISERPIWAKEFAIWSHLDGAIVNQPENGARSIINRVTNEMVRRGKHVDMVIFKDVLCGTRARPCPKYGDQGDTIGLHTAPDIFLLPQRKPDLTDTEPPVHTLDTLRLPRILLETFHALDHPERHVWTVHVKLQKLDSDRLIRLVQIWHNGEIVIEMTSRSWRRGE